MAGRIVLFGATGYTGRLAAEAHGRARAAARCSRRAAASALEALAAELGGLETGRRRRGRPAEPCGRWSSAATCSSPRSARSPAGARRRPRRRSPRARTTSTRPASRPSSGEVFERYGPRRRARRAAALLTAFGYDWVPGNLAGALALERAGEAATRVDVGYFITGAVGGMSGGTRASTVGAIVATRFALPRRAGPDRARRQARAELPGRRSKKRDGDLGRQLGALRAAAARAPAARGERLPRLVRPGSRADAGAPPASVGTKVPGAAKLLERGGPGAFVKGSTGGPGRRGAREVGLPDRRDRLRRRRPRAHRGAAHGRRRLHVHRPHPRLGRPSARPPAASRPRARSARSTASGWRSSPTGAAEAGLGGAPGAARVPRARQRSCGCST